MGTIALAHLGLLVGVLHGAMGVTLNVEEGFPAYVANRLLAGSPDMAPTRMAYTVYESGTTMVGAITVPAFWWGGETQLALKVVSIAISVAGVVLVTLLAMAWLGDICGAVAGILFAAGPPALVFRGVQTLGDTSEVLPLLALQWLLLAHLRRAGPTPLLAFALGATGGLGVSFSYALLPSTVLVAFAFSATRHEKPIGRAAVAVFGLGSLAGLAIPLANALLYAVPIFEVRGHRPGEMLTGVGRWWSSLADLATGRTRDFDYGQERGEMLHPCVAIQRALSVAVFTASAWRERAALVRLARSPFGATTPIPPVAWAIALHAAYFAAYCTTAVQSHYLLVLLAPTDAILAAALIGRLPRGWAHLTRGRCATLATLAFAALHLIPIAPLWSLLPAARPLYQAPAASDHDWAWRIWGYAPRHALEQEGVSPRQARGAGQSLGEDGGHVELMALAARYPVHAADLAKGYGYGLAWIRRGAPESVEELVGLPVDLRWQALHGFGRCLGQRFPWALGYQRARDLVADPSGADALLEGYGSGLGWRLWHRPAVFAAILDAAEDDDAAAIGRGLASRLDDMCGDTAERQRRMGEIGERFRPAR